MDYFAGYPPWHPFQPMAMLSPEEQVDYHLNIASMQLPGRTFIHYEEAIRICKTHRLRKKEANIHCILAQLLSLSDIHQAMKEAQHAINIDSNYERGYYCRAHIHKKFAQHHVSTRKSSMASAYYSKCIEDLLKCYDVSGRTLSEALYEAIIIAINQGLTQLLKLEEYLTLNKCCEIVTFIATTGDKNTLSWKCKHIDYLIRKGDSPGSGLAATLSCDLSNVQWRNTLQKSDLNPATVQAIVSLKGTFSMHDIELMVMTAADQKVEVLHLAIQNCSQTIYEANFKHLFNTTLELKKLKFAKEILTWLKSTSKERIELFLKAIECCNFSVADDCLRLGNDSEESSSIMSDINVVSVLKVSVMGSSEERHNRISFLQGLFKSGLDANKRGEYDINPLDFVLELPKEKETTKIELLSLLIQHGASIECCTYQKKNQTTLLHIVTKFAIESGSADALKLLKVACEHYPYENEAGIIQDKTGNTPYHMVMERKCSPNTIKICEILSKHPINPNLANNHGKRPIRANPQKSVTDKRCAIMQTVAGKFQLKKKGKKKKKSRTTGTSVSSKIDSEMPESTPDQPTVFSKPVPVLEFYDIIDEVKSMLSQLSNQPQSYFEPPSNYKRQRSLPVKDTSESTEEQKPSTSNIPIESVVKEEQNLNMKIVCQVDSTASHDVDVVEIDKNFDGCPWEIECTDKVKKFFANAKVPKPEKEAVVKTIRKLADGIPLNNPNLSKDLGKNSRYKIFEAHYSKGSRILFEIAVQFSPRMTSGTSYMYSEVIRLWDIVRHHDNLNRSIEHAVECIEKSRQRGETAAVRTPLKAERKKQTTRGQEKVRLPQYYVCHDEFRSEVVSSQTLSYLPAGSTRDDEYNVITFYSFNSSFIQSMLNGDSARRDFPFKEWPKEHDIINMPQGKVSILLLGRSGTGKTTCCLYRLWNQFQNYWAQAVISVPLITRRPLAILQNKEVVDPGDSDSQDDSEEELDTCGSLDDSNEDNLSEPDSAAQLPLQEHFHQVFITKNYVLCAQMKKRFYDLAAGRASDLSKDHMEFEDANLPNSLSAIDDLAYPLFLTARQFFILLDNSLEDGTSFFKRDKEGKLMEKILSSDYDHEDPDTLLDLEVSDSEDEIDPDSDFEDELTEPQPATEKKKLLQRREVTASYFAEIIWPKISKSVILRDAKIDPLLVWMEIKSFIKGSMHAVEKKDGYLSQEEYDKLGKKMAPNYEDRRQDIYKIFELYKDYIQNHKFDDNIFDECDLNFNLYSRLNALKDLPWSIHSIYIDEVQDFTQAELSILIRICRDPNDLFLTGDTAQSIMRGISFRFGDLKSIFYRASKQISKSVKSVPVEVPKVDELTINFRSHTGILKLAASIIDLMKHFFPNSFDRLPGDEGMFPGPTPVVLDACHVSDLALVLRTNKRESSTIEFGAHQVIIVQSEEAKKNIPDVLNAGIVLTVFESKGLEFDDVLLYNFFKDSKIEKDWRVVTAFIEDNHHHIVNDEPLFSEKPRKLKFNKTQHKSLNAELKYLYTAITRAKCNLWIYDSDETKRLPVFDYWSKRGLVKVVRISDINKEDQSNLFSATSSKEEWKLQGDYFKKKRLWEPAMKCYQRAECPHLVSEARAYSLAQQAHTPGLRRVEIEEIYLESAHAFLKCDQSQHDYACLENAAKCLKNAKRYKESSQLYTYLGQHEKAWKGYRKSKDVEGLARLKHNAGDFNGVIRLLLKHNRVSTALKYASIYESTNVPIDECFQVRIIASEFLAKPKTLSSEESFAELDKVMEYVPLTDRVSYFKVNSMYDKACEILVKESQYKDVYRIYKAQGWHGEGAQIANSQKDREVEEMFLLMKATSEMGSESEELATTMAMLKNKWGYKSEREAKVSLIYGICKQDPSMIMSTCKFFKVNRNPVAHITAFNAAIRQAKYNDAKQRWENIQLERSESLLDLSLDICKEIKEIVNALRKSSGHSFTQDKLISQIESFYGLERKELVIERELSVVYFIPSSSFPWTNSLLNERLLAKASSDADGMLQLNVQEVHRGICRQLEHFLKKLVIGDKFGLVQNFIEEFRSQPLYKLIKCSNGYLTELVQLVPKFSKSHDFLQYLKMLSTAYDISHYGNTEIDSETQIIQYVLDAISAQATCYLPYTTLAVWSDHLSNKLREKIANVLSKNEHDFNFNEWFQAWQISCISRKESSNFKDKLIRRSVAKNQGDPSVPPPAYVLDRNNQYQHLILQWLNSCDFFHNEKPFPSSTIAVHNVLRHIATTKSVWNTVSVANLINVLTIHSTAILTMFASCLVRLPNAQAFTAYLPFSYKNVVDNFHNMIAMQRAPKLDFFRTCFSDAMSRRYHEILPRVNKLIIMLRIMLEVMIGLRNEDFNPLKYALSITTHEIHHCLIFVLTLFSNIGLISDFSDANLQRYRLRIYECVKKCNEPKLKEACEKFLTSRTIVGCFGVIRNLLEASKDSLFELTVQQDGVYFNLAELRKIPFARLLNPIPAHLLSKHPAISMKAETANNTPNVEMMTAPEQHYASAGSYSDFAVTDTGSEIVPDSMTTSSSVNVVPSPEFHTLDSVEAEYDLELQESTLKPVQPEIVKDPMVDEETQFCRVCACQLTLNEDADGEKYSDHCRSENHLTNTETYMHFEAEVNDYYNPRKTALLELQPKCGKLYEIVYENELKSVEETIERELEDSDQKIKRIKDSAEWREGFSLLQRDILEKLDSIIMKTKGLLEKCEEKKEKLRKTKEEQRRKGEEEEKEEDREDELPEDLEVIAAADAMSGGKSKEHKRVKVKRRKRMK